MTKIEHLKNIDEKIKDEKCFKEIELNKYRKSLNILLKERGFYHSGTVNANRFRAQLFFSQSLFNMYLKNDATTLHARGYELYKTRFFDEYQALENSIHRVYTEFVKRVVQTPAASQLLLRSVRRIRWSLMLTIIC